MSGPPPPPPPPPPAPVATVAPVVAKKELSLAEQLANKELNKGSERQVSAAPPPSSGGGGGMMSEMMARLAKRRAAGSDSASSTTQSGGSSSTPPPYTPHTPQSISATPAPAAAALSFPAPVHLPPAYTPRSRPRAASLAAVDMPPDLFSAPPVPERGPDEFTENDFELEPPSLPPREGGKKKGKKKGKGRKKGRKRTKTTSKSATPKTGKKKKGKQRKKAPPKSENFSNPLKREYVVVNLDGSGQRQLKSIYPDASLLEPRDADEVTGGAACGMVITLPDGFKEGPMRGIARIAPRVVIMGANYGDLPCGQVYADDRVGAEVGPVNRELPEKARVTPFVLQAVFVEEDVSKFKVVKLDVGTLYIQRPVVIPGKSFICSFVPNEPLNRPMCVMIRGFESCYLKQEEPDTNYEFSKQHYFLYYEVECPPVGVSCAYNFRLLIPDGMPGAGFNWSVSGNNTFRGGVVYDVILFSADEHRTVLTNFPLPVMYRRRPTVFSEKVVVADKHMVDNIAVPMSGPPAPPHLALTLSCRFPTHIYMWAGVCHDKDSFLKHFGWSFHPIVENNSRKQLVTKIRVVLRQIISIKTSMKGKSLYYPIQLVSKLWDFEYEDSEIFPLKPPGGGGIEVAVPSMPLRGQLPSSLIPTFNGIEMSVRHVIDVIAIVENGPDLVTSGPVIIIPAYCIEDSKGHIPNTSIKLERLFTADNDYISH